MVILPGGRMVSTSYPPSNLIRSTLAIIVIHLGHCSRHTTLFLFLWFGGLMERICLLVRFLLVDRGRNNPRAEGGHMSDVTKRIWLAENCIALSYLFLIFWPILLKCYGWKGYYYGTWSGWCVDHFSSPHIIPCDIHGLHRLVHDPSSCCHPC